MIEKLACRIHVEHELHRQLQGGATIQKTGCKPPQTTIAKAGIVLLVSLALVQFTAADLGSRTTWPAYALVTILTSALYAGGAGLWAALELAKAAAADAGWTLVNSLNPYRIEGQKTAAFEVVEDLGRAPDFQFMPVGNAGNITAYWLGYREWHAALKKGLPRMMGWQAKGAAPLVLGRPVARPRTLASAIRIGRPASWSGAVKAKEESGGMIGAVSDAEIVSAWRRLAREEGVFCEPASAAGLAGLIRYAESGVFHRMDASRRKGVKVVCVLTGHGLKDPDTPTTLPFRQRTLEADPGAVRRALRSAR